MRLHINFLVQQTSFIQTSFHLWKYPSSYIIFLMMLTKRYYQEKVYISSGCQTLLFHMWPCHKQRNCMSCTNIQYWEQLMWVAIHHHFHRTTYCTSRYEKFNAGFIDLNAWCGLTFSCFWYWWWWWWFFTMPFLLGFTPFAAWQCSLLFTALSVILI